MKNSSRVQFLRFSMAYHDKDLSFLGFKQLSGQSSSLFLFTIVDKILQTMLVVTKAAVQHFRAWWLNLLWAVSEYYTVIVSIAVPLISDRQLWTSGCSLRKGKIRAKMRRLWNWFEGLVSFRLIFNMMQIKDLEFSDKCLIDRKWPLHYQLQYKRVLKTSLFCEGRLYQW